MRARAVVLAVAIVMAPLGVKAADLVLSWQKGYSAQEDEALSGTRGTEQLIESPPQLRPIGRLELQFTRLTERCDELWFPVLEARDQPRQPSGVANHGIAVFPASGLEVA